MNGTRVCRRRPFLLEHPLGRGFGPNGPAENYALEVTLVGPLDPKTGMVLPLRKLDERMENVLATLKTQASEWSVPDLETLTIRLAEAATEKLKASADFQLEKVRLYQGDDYWVDVWP